MKKLKQTMLKVLRVLLKNSKMSDRRVAKIVGISQPTVTRIRQKLEAQGYIKGYTSIPNLSKLGFEGLVFSVICEDALEKEVLLRIPHDKRIIYAVSGFESVGIISGDIITISVHKSYTDYLEFAKEYKVLSSFHVLTTEKPKRFCFGDLVEVEQECGG